MIPAISLKPLVEHIYLEDRKQAVLQVATEKGVSISYRVTKSPRRTRRARTSTTWLKGTVISYSRNGYVVSFDGCGPEENEMIYSLKQGIDKGEVKLL